jgi:hypothetical protein
MFSSCCDKDSAFIFTTVLQQCNIAYQIVFFIFEKMTNLDIVSLRSDVSLPKPLITHLLRNRSWMLSRTVQIFVCMNTPVCWSGRVYLQYLCICKEKYIRCIYPLSRIHNTSLTSAFFELDSRECECL